MPLAFTVLTLCAAGCYETEPPERKALPRRIMIENVDRFADAKKH
jgi:hypothetical protein